MHELSLRQIRDGLRQKQFSSREITQHFLDRISRYDGQLNSFITVTAERALDAADQADKHLANGEYGLLTGVPMAQKDIFCTQGVKTTCGSLMLDNFEAPYDAFVVQQFAAAGAVCLGKTNMDEFAMGSSNETSYYGPVKNPWDLTRVPGGSSGGSAAAVAARLCPAATATDTGGSIRQPASLCGLTGLKPTYGRVSRFGMIAFASSLDQGGPLTYNAEDAALMLQAMAGFDANDSTSVKREVDDYLVGLEQPLNGLKLGVVTEFFNSDLDSDIAAQLQTAIKQLQALGAEIKDVSLPNIGLSIPAYYIIAPAECSSNLARFDGVRYGYRCQDPKDLTDLYLRSRGEAFGDEVKQRILIGTYALSAGYYDAYYLKAQKVRRLIADDFKRALGDVDAILAPSSPCTAFKIGEKIDDPISMYLSDVYTIGANLAGIPALSMPAGLVNGLPVGLQLVGNYFQEARLLNIAHQFQQHTDWHQCMPTAFANSES